MRLRDHVYLSANYIPFPSHPNSHRLASRRVVSQSSSDSAVDVTLYVCGFCVSIRLLFQEEYDLEANYLLKDMESGKLLHFKNLKQYRDETNATIGTNYFIIALKNMKDGFSEKFEQFKTNKSTLTFIVNPLNTNTNEINIEPLGTDAGSLQMQLLDLKTKDLWVASSQNSRASWKSWRSRNACTSRSTSGQL
ncbi:hypothetical protein AVEN_237924-1 [Araneus ventricosus]|uniref:Uncharacterized protein n=1 Tax=Araneus ventricosus TaxID=182803 RepID=A0A4Y2FZ78_ARAVE|nr:hypothetical protein AVEN_237924-1 [Araneus ventricosus]